MPGREELPRTLERSPKKAQRTWIKAHDSAVESYGEGERAHRTAFAALKHSFQKIRDRWVPKGHKGPSDPQAAKGGKQARDNSSETYGGVDLEGSTRDDLYERAKELDIKGRSHMTKKQLAREIAKKQ